MKITIELNEEESKRDNVNRLLKGSDALSLLSDWTDYLRTHAKYPEVHPKTIEEIKDDFWAMMKDYELSLEDLG